MGYGKDTQAGLRQPARALREKIPEVYEAFSALAKASMADNVLDAKTKELIALAVAVTNRCDGCIASHARGAARQGATADEVADALGVAILMNGGPSTVYGPRAFEAFREFAGEDV